MTPEGWFQLALLVCEVSAAVLALAVNRYFSRLDLLTPLQAAIVVAPLAIFAASAAALAVLAGRLPAPRVRRAILNVAANLIGVGMALASLEVGVRVLTEDAAGGRWFAGTLLLPRRWEEVKAENRDLLARNPANVSYFVPDAVLGWAPGRSRQDITGLYSTSVEGLRSVRAGVEYAARPATRRIAIVGDSYTFGLEVPFAESWGARLETLLGANATVLNFGVDGYGLDQAYLRFERDALRWKPAVTVLGFIEHDLYRSLSVYSFITFPEWGFPFSKPRFVLKNGRLARLNDTVESPERILTRDSVEELPFVALDPGYNAAEWTAPPYEFSYLLRYVVSKFPRSPRTPVDHGDEIDHLNTALIHQFLRRALEAGTAPVIAYLPSRGDFSGQDRSMKGRVLARLRDAGIPYVDLTTCLGAIGERAFIPGRPHYSAAGNLAVAQCLHPLVQARLADR